MQSDSFIVLVLRGECCTIPATGAGRIYDYISGIMAKVEIYTSIMCPYCSRAVGLLQSKKVNFEQIDVSMSGVLRQTMRSRAGGRKSVPQIFINDEHIGGCDDLMALESAGDLDALLNRPAP